MAYQIKYNKFNTGFSLVEVMIVIGIFALFIGFSDSVFTNFKTFNETKIATQSIVQAIRHAQSNASKIKENDKWGAYITSQNATIFKGNSYALRDNNFDQVIALPRGITIDSDTEIVFEKVTGETNDVGTITVTDSDGNENDIFINEKGTITY